MAAKGDILGRFDRYMLSQLLTSFGFFALILVLIYWVNRAVVLFDQLIADGQNAAVFFQFTTLSLPSVIAIVLPIASFAAAVFVTNRMSNESELTIVQATGFSSYRVARPILIFGGIVAFLMFFLVHFIQPLAEAGLNEREEELAENVTARLLSSGTFVHPSKGVTFYISDITPRGELLNVFLSNNTDPDTEVTYTAQKAFLVKGETGPQLIMIEGLIQRLDKTRGQLGTTRFNDFAFDIEALLTTNRSSKTHRNELSTLQLLAASDETRALTGSSKGTLVQTGHYRVIHPILVIVTAIVGFSTLMVAGFSRFGVWRQIVLAILLIMGLQLIESTTISAVRKDHQLWPILYLPAALGGFLSFLMLFKANNPWFLRLRGQTRADSA